MKYQEMEVFRNTLISPHYQISNLGRVRSLKCNKERILKPSTDGQGYAQVCVSVCGKQTTAKIHQLVAIAFLDHTPCGMEAVVKHINRDKLDNRAENLKVVSSEMASSMKKKSLVSSSKYVGVSWDKARDKWISQISINGKQKWLGAFKYEMGAYIAYLTELKKIKLN